MIIQFPELVPSRHTVYERNAPIIPLVDLSSLLHTITSMLRPARVQIDRRALVAALVNDFARSTRLDDYDEFAMEAWIAGVENPPHWFCARYPNTVSLLWDYLVLDDECDNCGLSLDDCICNSSQLLDSLGISLSGERKHITIVDATITENPDDNID